jgi:hypothetical protein
LSGTHAELAAVHSESGDCAMSERGEVGKHAGSCHCGTVKFEIEVDATSGMRCNCTVCTKVGLLMGMAKPEGFRILAGERDLSFYEWGAKTAKRYFCKRCGVSCFSRGHLEQLGGDYVCVSFNALDDVDPNDVKAVFWDGRHDNWQAGSRDTPWPIRA